MNKRFLQALLRCNSEALQSTPIRVDDINVPIPGDPNGWTALHYVVSVGRVDVLAYFLSLGGNASVVDDYQWTPLHLAIFFRAKSCVELLLVQRSIKVNQPDHQNQSPLHIAAMHYHDQDIFELLLSHGSDLEGVSDLRETPVETAIKHHNQQARFLIRKLNPDYLEQNSVKLLMLACTAGFLDIMGYLLFDARLLYDVDELSAQITQQRESALRPADALLDIYIHFSKNMPNKVMLLEQYVNQFQKDDDFLFLVAEVLASFDSFDIVYKFLKERLVEAQQQQVALKLMKRIWQSSVPFYSQQAEVTKLLELFPDMRDKFFGLAIEIDHVELFKFLLKYQELSWVETQLKKIDHEGNTILHDCARNESTNVLNHLCSSESYKAILHGLSNCLNAQGLAPIHIAARQSSRMVIQRLALDLCVDIEAKTRDDANTALHNAVACRNYPAISQLMMLGANIVDVKDAKDNHAIEIAGAIHDDRLVRFMQTYHQNPRRGMDFPLQRPDYQYLAFQGGGVKGVAFLGAIRRLIKHEYLQLDNVTRVAGTSAGSITSLLLSLGYDMGEIDAIMQRINFKELLDEKNREAFFELKQLIEQERYHEIFGVSLYRLIKRFKDGQMGMAYIERLVKEGILEKAGIHKPLNYFGAVDDELTRIKTDLEYFKPRYRWLLDSIRNDRGLFSGEVLLKQFKTWIRDKVSQEDGGYNENLTFAELAELVHRYEDSGRKYKHLHVVAFDLKAQRMQVFSHLDTPHVRVADAVRCSMAIQLFFTPFQPWDKNLGRPSSHQYIDGGNTKNYCLDIFDKQRFVASEAIRDEGDDDKFVINHHALGFRLVSTELMNVYDHGAPFPEANTEGFMGFLWQVISACLTFTTQESDYQSRVENIARSVHIDVGDVGTIDFDLSNGNRDGLIQRGGEAGDRFINRVKHSFVDTEELDRHLKTFHTTSEGLFFLGPHQQFERVYQMLLDSSVTAEMLSSWLSILMIPLSIRDSKGNTFAHRAAQDQNVDALEKLKRLVPNLFHYVNFNGERPSGLQQDGIVFQFFNRVSHTRNPAMSAQSNTFT